MHIIQASQRGFVHRETGIENQDRVAKARFRDIYAAALCDGAGSYERTGEGAEAMSAHIADYLARNFEKLDWKSDSEIIDGVCTEIRKRLAMLRAKTGCTTPGAFSSTVIGCAMKAGTGEYISVHLGDGMLAARKQGGPFRMLTAPARFDDSCTVLTTSPLSDKYSTMKVARGKADMIIMCSDGAEGKLYQGTEVLPVANALAEGAFACRFDEIEQRLSGAISRVWKSMDDLSVVLMLKDLRPTPVGLGYTRDQPLSLRRALKAYASFAAAREMGSNDRVSAAAAGWRDKPTGKQLTLIRAAHGMGIM